MAHSIEKDLAVHFRTKMRKLMDDVCDSVDAVDGDRETFSHLMFTLLLAEASMGAAWMGMNEDHYLDLCRRGLDCARGEIRQMMKKKAAGRQRQSGT